MRRMPSHSRIVVAVPTKKIEGFSLEEGLVGWALVSFASGVEDGIPGFGFRRGDCGFDY